jgi:hypothetical protein
MMGQRLVLRSKSTGKIASRKDQGKKALVIEAQRLTNQGLSGGITSLLLPQSAKEKAEIAAIKEKYEVDKVKTRRGEQTGKGDKAKLTKALKDDDLICKLAVLYGNSIGNIQAPHLTSAKAFNRWLKDELARKNSTVYAIVLERAPILLNVERSDRWWADAFAQRRKTQS